ncbi:MAG: alpha-mannosidase [Clostridia bacterium]|nr:alpha-mannosidase [Clostridia bacterium]
MNKTVYLISNAHLDPVWQWEWEEGAAAAVSTFRVAAKFCRQRDKYVFCHNEASLYEWVKEYEPPLFEEIKKLVGEGKWVIVGGWYVQPDCNMPSGETFIRQAAYGRKYFYENFGVIPDVANNYDSFGHSRGLVQILSKCGYKYYIHCRPDDGHIRMPNTYRWVGFDGSQIICERQPNGYGTALGTAYLKAAHHLNNLPDGGSAICLWGVGDHGGGASEDDLDKLDKFISDAEKNGDRVVHGSPNDYFDKLDRSSLPVWDKSVNPWAVGCYTSQSKLKAMYRALEDTYYATEKLCMLSRFAHGYPAEALTEAEKALLFATFHDYLPGSSVEPVEAMGIRQLGGAYDALTKLRAASVFALCAGQPAARPDEIPVIVCNPHPYPVKGVFECEFMLWDQGWGDTVKYPHLYDEDGVEVPCQPEKELSNIPIDWRKRISFYAEAKPCGVTRFNCRFEETKKQKPAQLPEEDGELVFDNGKMRVKIGKNTGLITSYSVGGVQLLHGACRIDVLADRADAWGMTVNSYRDVLGSFTLLDEKQTAEYCMTDGIPPVRVIENGAVRTVVEAAFGYGSSRALIRYGLHKNGADIDVSVRIRVDEKQKMIKLSLPADNLESVVGQVPYGREELSMNGDETVSQRYKYLSEDENGVLVRCRSTYGSSVEGDEYKISLLHTVPYTAHPLGDRRVMPDDRFMPHMDTSEQVFEFRISGGEGLLDRAERLTQEYCEAPYCMSFFPSGDGKRPETPVLLEGDGCVILSAYKQSEYGSGDVIRLFNPTDAGRAVTLTLDGKKFPLTVPAFSFDTYLYDGGLTRIRADEMPE